MLFIRSAGIISSQIAAIDSDAQAFLTATGITDATISSAINTLVISAKANGWWTLCDFIYPMVGGTSTTHSYNLKNTSLYQITWNGTVTHNSNGVTSNGSTGYGNTGYNVNLIPTNNGHLSCYSRSSARSFGYDMGGILTGSPDTGSWIVLDDSGPTNYTSGYITTGGAAAVWTPSGTLDGHFLTSRIASNNHALYKNGSSIASNSGNNASTAPSQNLYLLCRNRDGSAGSYTTRNHAFFTGGTGINSTIAAAMYTDIQNFQTSLNRQV